jgi:O-antigen/teichoic acid export membrane protein
MTRKVGADRVMTKNRPHSIIWFERLFLMAVLGTIVGVLVTVQEYIEYYSNFTKAQMTYVYISWGIFCIGWATLLLSWYYAARRAKIWAKWIFLAACFAGLLIFLAALDYASGIGLIASSMLNLLMVLSAGCLFLPSARNWFVTESRGPKADVGDLKDISR